MFTCCDCPQFLQIFYLLLACCQTHVYFSFSNNQEIQFMKKRISRVLNFFAFNFLFFALYLNFIHRDNNTQSFPVSRSTVAATKATVLVANPDEYLNKPHKEAHVNESQN